MGTGVCNCSKSPQHDSDMQSIAKLEETISLNDKKQIEPKKRYAPPTPYAVQKEGHSDFDFDSNTSTMEVITSSKVETTSIVYSMSCDSYRDCVAIKRITTCLVFYQMLDISDYSRLTNYFDAENYPYLLEDYHHILHHHIGDETKSIQQSRIEFESIHNIMMQSIRKCNIEICDKFKRNNRFRDGDRNNIFHTNDILLNYYVDTVDMIHCFFIHPFHCGFRLKLTDFDPNRRRNIGKKHSFRKRNKRRKSEQFDTDEISRKLLTIAEETKSQCDLEEDDNTKLYIDEQLQKIKTKLMVKKKQFENIFKNNKFIHCVPEYIQTQQTQKDNAENEYKSHLKWQLAVFGQRYYYWKYYEQCTQRDTAPNDGYNVNDWYIEKKYINLKTEMCNNAVYKLQHDTFKEIVFTANKKINSSYAKTKIADVIVLDKLKYGIGYGQCLTAKHVQAVLIYTHCNELAHMFRESGKRKTIHDTDTELRRRASEFWHLAKLLRETVEVFGVHMDRSKISAFYHNMDCKFRFQSTTLYLALPTSMTIYLEVATLYSNDDGVMLEMEANDDRLRYFDCSWLSNNGNNGERLFIGGQYALRFKSIRYIASNVNYEYFMHAISIFDYAISGRIPHCDSTRNDLEIIAILVNNRKDLAEEGEEETDYDGVTKHDEYINDIFYDFCMNRHEIFISMWNMERYYYSLQLILFHNKTKHKQLCVFSNLCKIFQNCKRICIEYYEYNPLQLDASFLDMLLNELKLIPKWNQKNLLIELTQVQYEQNILEKFKNKYIAKSWCIQESGSSKISIFKMSMAAFAKK